MARALAAEVPEDYAVGTLRLSVGRHTSADDIATAAGRIVAAAARQLDYVSGNPDVDVRSEVGAEVQARP